MPVFPAGQANKKIGDKGDVVKRKRHIFSPEEDAKLKKLVEQKGCLRWEEIASEMDGLNARQCRDRWTNFLDPKISSRPWTLEEEQRLLQLVRVMGNCWVQISRRFKGRTDIQIKNKYNSLMQKMDLTKTLNPLKIDKNYGFNYMATHRFPVVPQNYCSEPETSDGGTPPVDFLGSNPSFKAEESIFGLDFEEAFKLFA